jgi:hypothetical protein
VIALTLDQSDPLVARDTSDARFVGASASLREAVDAIASAVIGVS